MGSEGQKRLRDSSALVAGCGALGSASAELLARAGVGTITIVDRDIVEWSNLQRQGLYGERDARDGVPKAEAARRRLREINSEITVHACVEHLDRTNVAELARGAAVIVDGLDNIPTRFLLNDFAVRSGLPFVHAAAVGMEGRSFAVLSSSGGACLRCLFPEAPPPGTLATCETAGVFGPLVSMVGAFAAGQAIKILAGRVELVARGLWSVDLESNRWRGLDSFAVADPVCPCCAARRFEWLEGELEDRAAVLCGRGAVQVCPAPRSGERSELDLEQLAVRLAAHGRFTARGATLHGILTDIRNEEGEPIELTVFGDGRAIVGKCTNPVVARSVYDRFVGA